MAPRAGSILTLTALMAFLGGAALVAYGRWTRPIADSAAALQSGDAERALVPYAASSQRFRQIALAQRFLPSEYSLVTHNQLAVLYSLGRYDQVIEQATEAPPTAGPHFWSGCALFKKSTQQQKPEGQLEWLTRAQDEFKLALAAAPDDWDTKFNYELTSRLVVSMRPTSSEKGKQQSNAPSTLIQLLRPQQQQQQQQRAVKKVG